MTKCSIAPDAETLALDWVLRLSAGPLSAEERQAFGDWLAADPDHQSAFDSYSAIWEATEFGQAAAELRAAAPRHRWVSWAGGIAAALVIGLSLPEALFQWQRWGADVATAAGERRAVTLADGSTVMLNAVSAITYDMEGATRRVGLLQGEAWFDVTHDPARPFVVETPRGTVTVLGTSFAVRLDAAGDEIVLERGQVAVAGRDGDTRILQPDERLTLGPRGPDAPQAVNAGNLLAWREGRLIVAEQPLAEVARLLAAQERRRLVILDSEAGELRISGSYNLSDIDGALRLLAGAAGADLTLLPGGVIILR